MNGAAAVLALAMIGCGGDSAPQAKTRPERQDGRLLVAAVNYPLAYAAERVGGDAVEVVFPLPEDVDPAFWQPAAEDVARFQEADLILLNGAGYAGWTRTASLPGSRVVDTSEAFTGRLLERADQVTHSHGPEGEHAHGETAFTTWLDPELALLHAAAIRDALAARRPESADSFTSGLAALEADLRGLDARLAAAVARAPDRAVIFSHPVYDYLVRRYGIAGPSVHWEPDEAPSAAQWRELEQLAAEHGARWLVWEAEPLEATARGLRERGIESAVFAPCGNRPAGGDLLEVMTENAAELERIFAPTD